MPKIFVLRHQLAEQQAKLKLQAKGSDPSGSVSPSSDEEKFEPQQARGTCIVNPASPTQASAASAVPEQPLELIASKRSQVRPTPTSTFDLDRYFKNGGCLGAAHLVLGVTEKCNEKFKNTRYICIR
jgi:hypothetical protein